ncbi:MAG: S8 family serine peptidase [Eubacterium sp.]|nr:S8 family serine peptidase [Eubacterium sp.]
MIRQRIVTFLTVFSFGLYYIAPGSMVTVRAEQNISEKQYIVGMESADQREALEEEREEQTGTEEINANGEDNLKENNMAPLALTEEEAEELAEDPGVAFVEEDVCVRASAGKAERGTEGVGWHKKEIKIIKKNRAAEEWNIRMIHGDQRKQETKRGKKKNKEKRKIRIAVLDSGVDHANDIHLAETVSLVPGEEGMSPLFMDGTGHGNSVAGLIAAEENGEGITGVAPGSEIYSYRVLDDDNCAPVSRVVEAIYMAIDRKVDIINMSFGVDMYSEALAQAVKDASDARILVIAAAGNTGEKGVQYPAALEDVMAVGSVDKNGDVADSSSVGEEVEIVAPGELVRSTGVLGEEIVSSGTSLAAPQVAGVAALIWEKDPDMPSDFVRALLNESANGYGDQEQYGNGLVDARYALEHYEEFKKNYKKNKETKLEENKEKVLSFKDTGCVKGSWATDDHGSLIPSRRINMQLGARFNDNENYKESVNKSINIFRGMIDNPWWHGYHKENYIASYIYITQVANQMGYGGTISAPKGLSVRAKNGINNDIAFLQKHWKDELYWGTVNAKAKRDFVWGMATHTLADTFAHSAYVWNKTDKKWIHLVHNEKNAYRKNRKYAVADKVTKYSERWDDARNAVEESIRRYEKTGHPAGTYNEFRYVKNSDSYRLGKIYDFVKDVAGVSVASGYKGSSCSTK